MVNNAGIAIGATLMHEATEEQWDLLMNVNARSVFLGSKYAIAQMLKQEPHASGDRGWIINTASVAGLVGVPTTRKSTPNKASDCMRFKAKILDISYLFCGQRCCCTDDEAGGYRLREASHPLQCALPGL